MAIEILGSFDKNQLYCTGSFSKLLTTFVSLSFLAEKFDLNKILGDKNFFDEICTSTKTKDFLKIFQQRIGGQFTIHDLCSYYTGLPYTFDLTNKQLESVEAGNAFKHHSIMDEKDFLERCRHAITQVYHNHSKFHYSEISIIFLGYIIETCFSVRFEDLYQKYVIQPFNLSKSLFSRTKPENVYIQDLSDIYDYPSVAILDHGFFCYSNGFYTTLSDEKILLENLFTQPIFQFMIDIKHARAASNRLLNGLAIELRLVADDVIYGYDGLSFSGCNIWCYSSKLKTGYLTFTNSEEDGFNIIYGKLGKTQFDTVPLYTETHYDEFIHHFKPVEQRDIPLEFQGNYLRVKINEKELKDIFVLGNNFMIIRNPDEVRYELMFINKGYYAKGKDGVQGAGLGLYQAPSGNRYMLYDGTLYKKILTS